MQSQSDRRVRTFTIGFHEKAFDEAPYAKAVAEHLGTDHTELYVSAAEAASVIPDFRAFTTSRLPTPPRFPRPWCLGLPDST